MLNINPETVCYIIQRARQFHVKEEVVVDEVPDSPADNWAMQIMADHSGDMNFDEVMLAIKDLEPDQQATLVALMWLGRGDYSLDEWQSAFNDATDNLTDHTGGYLMGHPLVADYLLDGLSQHGYSCD